MQGGLDAGVTRIAVAGRRIGGARRRRRRYNGAMLVLLLPATRRKIRWRDTHADRAGQGDTGGCGQRGWRDSYLRVGEAKNPGPGEAEVACRASWGAFSAQLPDRGGFRYASAPGFADPSEGDDGAEHQEALGYFSLQVLTVNCTSWRSLIPVLARTEADVILAQEIKLGPDEADAAGAWLRRRGWNTVMSPSVRGPNGGWSAGVAVLARPHVGLSLPLIGTEHVVESRAVAVRMEAPGCRPCLAVSCYLKDGAGMGKENLEILRRIGTFVAAHGDEYPFIIGGDMQMTPQELATTGFAGLSSAVIAASLSPSGTCRTASTAREIDFFLVSRGLSAGIDNVSVVPRTGIKTHSPVMLTFKPCLTSIRALVIRQPPRLQTERIIGPVRAVADWNAVAEKAKALAADAANKDIGADSLHARLGEIYTEWVDLLELELIECTTGGQQMPKRGTRGRAPVLVWRSVLPERPKQDDGGDYAVAWRAIANTAMGLQRLAAQRRGRDSDDALADPTLDIADDISLAGDLAVLSVDDDEHAAHRDWRRQLDEARDDAKEHIADLRRLRGKGAIDDGCFDGDESLAIELATMLDQLAARDGATLGDLAAVRVLREKIGSRADDITAGLRKHHEEAWAAWLRKGIDKGAKKCAQIPASPSAVAPTAHGRRRWHIDCRSCQAHGCISA